MERKIGVIFICCILERAIETTRLEKTLKIIESVIKGRALIGGVAVVMTKEDVHSRK